MSVRTLEVWVRWSPDDERAVGTLAHAPDGYRFEYAPRWLDDGIDLSPRFPRNAGLLGPWSMLPGVFAGSLPDHWGRFVMDRRAMARGLRFALDLDRLAFLGDNTAGALVYRPPLEDAESQTSVVELQELATQTQLLLEGKLEDLAEQITMAGSSMGGTRPKYAVGIKRGRFYIGPTPTGAEAWLVKFPARSDPDDIGAVEYAYMQMAELAGLQTPEFRLFEGGVFGVKRFDRDNNRRLHILTFADVFDMGDLVTTYATGYEDLLRATWRIAGARAAREMLGRMVFNLLSHNRDDHVRNHAFLCDRHGKWTLSPVYDLTFAEGPNGLHSLALGESPNPTYADVKALAARLKLQGVDEAVKATRNTLASWPKLAKAAGVKASRVKEITSRLKAVDSGF
ncbi:MAG: type II toxin-antitoxin system HipA family toxin [Phycisphaeraceae bacterium]|nr:type II toxin-antitoxin system HipA family toxin [Phycisphaeraceae bacterium]